MSIDPVAEERLNGLESRLAHYEVVAEDLSDIVTAQGKRIDRLVQQIQALQGRIAELEAGPARAPQDERPPPHY
jgi:SlyX protein